MARRHGHGNGSRLQLGAMGWPAGAPQAARTSGHPRPPRCAGWLAGLALPALLACGQAESALPEAPTPKPVEVEVLAPQRYTTWLRVPGLVEARASMALSFRVPGFIARFVVDEGERVEAGAPIAELDRRDHERAVRMARAELARALASEAEAQRELGRQERLISSNSTSTQRLESARSAHEIAAAQARTARLGLEAAEASLEDCVLRAPVAGYLEERHLDAHEFAAAHTPVVVFTELDTVKVRAGVPDHALRSVAVGGRALIRSSAWPDREFEGRVRMVGVAADPSTHTLPIEIDVANADLALRPAMVVELALPGEGRDLLTVPMNAVVRDGGLRTLCFVTLGEGEELRAEPRRVALGALHGNRVEIASGLEAGERVIVRGHHFLEPGDPVHVSTAVVAGAPAETRR